MRVILRIPTKMTPNVVRKDKNGFEDPDIVSLSMTERIKKKVK